jgi:hypothetical protein
VRGAYARRQRFLPKWKSSFAQKKSANRRDSGDEKRLLPRPEL